MILLIVGVLLGIVALIWLWKVPIKKTVRAMKKSGSSTAEAYTMLITVTMGLAFAIYMLAKIL